MLTCSITFVDELAAMARALFAACWTVVALKSKPTWHICVSTRQAMLIHRGSRTRSLLVRNRHPH